MRGSSAVVPAQVARVVEGDVSRPRRVGLEPARRQQLGDERGVVHHLEVHAEVGVLVLERVQAVRAGGDDAARLAVLGGHDLLQHLAVLRRQLEEER
ncbi:MAG: hypothetical protein NZM11_13600, partial [Anaerolineales bacterium]|nr:hypothetical protein [Anaerolineales bacterium]